MQRGASMTTDKHVDPDAAPKIIEEENSRLADIDIPEGAVRFELTAEDIDEALSAESLEVKSTNPVQFCGHGEDALKPQDKALQWKPECINIA